MLTGYAAYCEGYRVLTVAEYKQAKAEAEATESD